MEAEPELDIIIRGIHSIIKLIIKDKIKKIASILPIFSVIIYILPFHTNIWFLPVRFCI